ncbi:MAG: undecaprenyl-phosphate galactose phosphotransferase WbaP, partial [Acetomicrobium sp.]
AKTGAEIVNILKNTKALGIKPVAILDDDAEKHGKSIEGVTVMGSLELAPHLAKQCNIRWAIMAMPGLDRERLLQIWEENASYFHHVIYIPDLFGFASLGVLSRDFGGILGLEVRQQLLRLGPKIAKAIVDAIVAAVALVVSALLIPFIALFIKLDSKGPVFYRQTRYGKDGKPFKAWKFRTMVENADVVLKEYLARHPELKEEWDRDQKLRDDPRVTRVGKFLRKTSLDELPQIFNVIKGEMSVVGPRPIVQNEIEKYGKYYSLYTKVKPGITGLWQVSGRNDVSYEERVALDAYYVRNWSVWLDLYILARTVPVALFGKGAY